MLTIIEGKKEKLQQQYKEKRKKKYEIFKRKYFELLEDCDCDGNYDWQKIVWYGAKMLQYQDIDTTTTLEEVEEYIKDCSVLKQFMAVLTYGEFMQIFPIDKYYDKTNSCKDYFSTISCLNYLHADKDYEIGNDLTYLLQEYGNGDIISFCVKEFLAIDKIRKMHGKQGIMEEFMNKFAPDVTRYSIHEKEGYVYNHKTQKTCKLEKPKKTSKTIKRVK